MEIIGSIVLAILQSILFYGKEIGISMFLFEIIGCGILCYILKKKNKIENKNGFLLMIPILLLSASYFIMANKTFYFANIGIIIVLDMMMIVILTHKKDYLKNHIIRSFVLTTDILSDYGEGFEYTKQVAKEKISHQNKVEKGMIKRIGISIAIVLAIVSVVIMLLASADSIFASLFAGVGDIFRKIKIGNLGNLIVRLCIIGIVYVLFLNIMLEMQEKRNVENKEEKEERSSKQYSFTIKLLLITLNIVYFIFSYIQIQSLFAKINIGETFNYAQYARSGFFQLMFVSLINFVLILVSNKYSDSKEKMIKILNVLLIVFTIIIVFSSMYRMHMYEMEYGLTYLRMFVYIILITELAVLVPVIFYLWGAKFDVLKCSMVILLAVYCIINYINIEKIIVSKNINRLESDTPVDYSYLSKIASEDSYSILEEKLKDSISMQEELEITKILLNIAKQQKEGKWQEFNISKMELRNKKVDIKTLENRKEELESLIIKEAESTRLLARTPKDYIYLETVGKEEYLVEEVDRAMGSARWSISKKAEKEKYYTKLNEIAVTTPSKIKFFENGLGFLERPLSIYCGASELLVTYDSGKTFEPISFPKGTFTLSNPEGAEWEECYDYFYLPTKESDGTLTVLVSGGYEGGYNGGKTRAKYSSKDNGHTWEFASEIWKGMQ